MHGDVLTNRFNQLTISVRYFRRVGLYGHTGVWRYGKKMYVRCERNCHVYELPPTWANI
jgi:hypothetical protein